MTEITPDRTLAGLFTELTRETATLFRQEISLAKAEVAEKIRQAGSGLIMLTIGGLLLFVALQALLAAAVLGLALRIPPWLAALAVAVAVAVVGAGVLARGLANLRRETLAPQRTIDTLRANTRWAREQMR
ncbi:MAG: phage holin family protein [Magnetospirillum sp.]|nr:phage holin family protein [Magnetospirillum sp.]